MAPAMAITLRLMSSLSSSSSSIACRTFSSSAVANYPRRALPKTTPVAPTPAQLATPPVPPQNFSTQQPPYKRTSTPFHIRQRQPANPRRYITDVETALPLPTTFPAGITSRAEFLASSGGRRPQIPEQKLAITVENPFPYKYYEISLRRSLNGLPATTKKHASALGLTARHQVVWRLVSPRAAGQILTLRELVAVRLVNEIPQKPVLPTGFAKVGNAVGNGSARA
ncbi:hypothetical protein HDU87_006813 [Geranomyces variabilis]|uniref:Large ribosomal subunit protein uL30-like ferredoxin-like fold domain-containing protein n=1 Tax=Geranomyces variabilis TaxID=109894 RepID=A0AAD5TSR9_9FUNG|nr:hypothetical protein HDU87_006813 [Geranomyces variabilis]